MVDADRVTVLFGDDTVVDNVSFRIHSGEFIGLIGPNGAGKTTLLRTLLGLQQPTKGKIAQKPNIVGYVPQRTTQHDSQIPLSVFEVVLLGSRGSVGQATTALETVGMLASRSKRFNELSGGQQQRILIAKALAAQPSLLLLDEPTTGIDEHSRIEFAQTLTNLTESGVAIIMVSHDVEMVRTQAKRVIYLNKTLIYDGPPERIETGSYLSKAYGKQHQQPHHHGVPYA